MRVKLYRAADMAQAMARVRAELGPDALILASRPVSEGIEVTAALEPTSDAPSPPEPARRALLAFHTVPVALHPALERGALATALGGALRFAALTLTAASPPLLLAGPPGAGKTLTVVRLATRLVMAGVTPTVVTADGKRAGAVEQLAAFTRLLGLELVIADEPAALGRALAERHTAPVLIDAPGTDPFDPADRDALAALAAAGGARSALVLPAGMDPAEAAELAAAFAELGATLMIATRLDLARRVGGIAAAAHAGRLGLCEAGIGPGAADGLVPLTPGLLAERMARAMPADASPAAPAAAHPNATPRPLRRWPPAPLPLARGRLVPTIPAAGARS